MSELRALHDMLAFQVATRKLTNSVFLVAFASIHDGLLITCVYEGH